MATQIDLGAVVPIGKGDWNSITTYERANIVRHNSTAWICKVATSMGIEPTEDSSDWYLLVKDTSSVTSVNGMKGDVSVDSVLVNPSTNDSSLKIASTSWVSTKVDNATNELSTQVTQADSKASSALQTANTANNKAEEALTKTGLPLGHIYLWPFSTPPDGSIQINGSTYNRELYSDLWNLIKAKGWYKSEAEWQSIASANGGYCPWYSDGDGSTTFRTPKFAPYQKLALASGDAGKYYEAGLPNIEGSIFGDICSPNTKDGALVTVKTSSGNIQYQENGSFNQNTVTFNASLSNSIYGNSTTVQPESHDWIVCVVAFGAATNIGSVDMADVMSAVSQLQATALPITGGKLISPIQEHVIGLEGTSVNIDLTTSNNFAHVVTGETTFTVNVKDDYGLQLGTLVLSNGGAFTVTWPSNFKWSDGTPPSLMASGIDVITFFTIDKGITFYAAQVMTGIA